MIIITNKIINPINNYINKLAIIFHNDQDRSNTYTFLNGAVVQIDQNDRSGSSKDPSQTNHSKADTNNSDFSTPITPPPFNSKDGVNNT